MALEDNIVSYWNLDDVSGDRRDLMGINTIREKGSTIGTEEGFFGHAVSKPLFISSLTFGGGWGWSLLVDGLNRFWFQSNQSSWSMLSTAGLYNTTDWYNLVATRVNGGKAKMYLNGELLIVSGDEDSTTTDYNATIPTNVDFHCGIRGDNTAPFDGVMDDMCFWSRAISASEVAELYNLGEGLELDENTLLFRERLGSEIGLTSYWPMDELSGDRKDLVGLANRRVLKESNSSVPTASGDILGGVGKINRGAIMESGASPEYQNLRIDNADLDGLGADTFSISFWIKRKDSLLGSPIMVDTSYGFGTGWIVQATPTNTINFIGKSLNATPWSLSSVSPATVGSGQFHHIVATRVNPSGYARLYIDGVLSASVANSNLTDYSTDFISLNDFTVGMRGDRSSPASGIFDEMGFWDREITYDEVVRLYNGGAGLNYDGLNFGGLGFRRTRIEYDQVRSSREYIDGYTMGALATAESGVNLESDFGHTITQIREIMYGPDTSGIGHWYDKVPASLSGLLSSVNQNAADIVTVSGIASTPTLTIARDNGSGIMNVSAYDTDVRLGDNKTFFLGDSTGLNTIFSVTKDQIEARNF